MSVYDNETTALGKLIRNKKPDCVDALEKNFWQARGDGLGIRESVYKAQLQHLAADHPEATIPPDDFPHRTDADWHAYTKEGYDSAKAAGEEDVDELNDIVMSWYALGREWGGSVYTASKLAVTVLTEIYEEKHDADEDEVREHLDHFPIERHKAQVINEFNLARAEGETVINAARRAEEKAKDLLIDEVYGSGLAALFGASDS